MLGTQHDLNSVELRGGEPPLVSTSLNALSKGCACDIGIARMCESAIFLLRMEGPQKKEIARLKSARCAARDVTHLKPTLLVVGWLPTRASTTRLT